MLILNLIIIFLLGVIWYISHQSEKMCDIQQKQYDDLLEDFKESQDELYTLKTELINERKNHE
jgi:hypothetical protein